MPRVTITVPEKAAQPYRFDLNRKVVTIGRGQDNDLVAGCGSVSGKHAEMVRVKGGYELIDVGSTNGIKIDGIRHQKAVLHTGMSVKLGDVEFSFSLNEEELAVLASEAEPVVSPVVSAEEEETSAKPTSKVQNDSEDDDSEDDGLDKLPELPPVKKEKKKEKAKEVEKEKKSEKVEREDRSEKESRSERKDRAERESESEREDKPVKPKKRDRDEYSESRAVTIGSGFILFTLIAATVAFFYGANTRHEKDTGEGLLKGIVNKEDVKKEEPAAEEVVPNE
jgi:pSer/pThr/pTyr-binding forkhead associated (FHA) protein